MMRINAGIVCVLAALTAGACSSGNGSSGPTPDAAPIVCGDNICAASEARSCPQDCGNGGGGSNTAAVCGNGQCETSKGESATSCPQDCGGTQPVCGNGTCEAGEDSTSCPTDCAGGGSGSGALDCADPNTAFGCAFCSAAMVCTPPYDAASCAACGF